MKRYAQARYLRKHPTRMEEALWERIKAKQLGVKFRRQHPMGRWIVDFYCCSLKLAVEIHGPEMELSKIEGLFKCGVKKILPMVPTMPLEQMLAKIRDALPKPDACLKHPESGRTNRGTCWACYAEQYKTPDS